MSKLVWDDEVEEIDLGDGDFVTIAKGVSVKDVLSVASETTAMSQSMAMLNRFIRSWRGPSFERDGAPVPVEAANIERLETGIATILVLRMRDKMASRMDDEERKVSTSDSSGI